MGHLVYTAAPSSLGFELQAQLGSRGVRKESSSGRDMSVWVERVGTELLAQASGQIPVGPLTGWVTSDKELHSSKPQFPHPSVGTIITSSWLVWG